MSIITSLTIEIEFTPGVWTDVTSYWRGADGLSVRHGRPTIKDDIKGTVCSFTVDNPDGRFTPESSNSAYYPNLVKNKRIRVKVTKSAITYTRFTGWIANFRPFFTGRANASRRCAITAVDALGRLGQRRLRSCWSEQVLYRARADGVHVDVWEVIGSQSASQPIITNLSKDASAALVATLTANNLPQIQVGSDNTVSTGQVMTVSPNSAGGTQSIIMPIQTGSLTMEMYLKSPQSVAAAATNFNLATFRDSGGSVIGYLGYDQSFSNTNIRIYDSAFNSLAAIQDLPFGQWFHLLIKQNGGTASHTDFTGTWFDATTSSAASNVNFDIRNVASVEFPGTAHSRVDCGMTGLAAWASTNTVDNKQGFYAGTGGIGPNNWETRIADLFHAVNELPVTLLIVAGTINVQNYSACTGDWSGRFASDVGQEIMRTVRGHLWCRPYDGTVLAPSFDKLRPYTPLATITMEQDDLDNLDLESGIDGAPTRAQVTTPKMNVVMVDKTAEAGGEFLQTDVFALNDNQTEATEVAAHYLVRQTGLRVKSVKYDLNAAVNDLVPTFFDETGPMTGLFPQQRLKLANLSTDDFPAGTYEAFVEGWTEQYYESHAYVDFDLSRASQLIFSEAWTGTNGAAWNASNWNTGVTATGGSAQIQGNQGRITASSVANGYTARRIASTEPDIDLLVSFTFNQSQGQARLCWRHTSTDLNTNGYVVRFDTTGTLRLSKQVGGTLTDLATGSFAIVSGTKYKVRLQSQGGLHEAKFWAASGAEPDVMPFHLRFVDWTFYAAGSIGLGFQNDGTTTPRTIDFDDFTLYECYF